MIDRQSGDGPVISIDKQKISALFDKASFILAEADFTREFDDTSSAVGLESFKLMDPVDHRWSIDSKSSQHGRVNWRSRTWQLSAPLHCIQLPASTATLDSKLVVNVAGNGPDRNADHTQSPIGSHTDLSPQTKEGLKGFRPLNDHDVVALEDILQGFQDQDPEGDSTESGRDQGADEHSECEKGDYHFIPKKPLFWITQAGLHKLADRDVIEFCTSTDIGDATNPFRKAELHQHCRDTKSGLFTWYHRSKTENLFEDLTDTLSWFEGKYRNGKGGMFASIEVINEQNWSLRADSTLPGSQFWKSCSVQLVIPKNAALMGTAEEN